MAMIKVKKKYFHQIFSLFIAFAMTCIMSFIVTFINLGLVENLLQLWLKSWATAFIIAYPLLQLLMPKIRWVVEKIFIFDEK